MKNMLVTILVLVGFSAIKLQVACAQVIAQNANYNVLVLDNEYRHINFTKGARLSFKLTSDETRYNAVISGIMPDYLNLNFGDAIDVPLKVTEFQKLYIRRDSRLSSLGRSLGVYLPAAGIIFFGADAFNTYHRGDHNFAWKPSAEIAGMLLAAGIGIRIAVSDKRYTLNNRWKLHIVPADGFKYRSRVPGES